MERRVWRERSAGVLTVSPHAYTDAWTHAHTKTTHATQPLSLGDCRVFTVSDHDSWKGFLVEHGRDFTAQGVSVVPTRTGAWLCFKQAKTK